MSTILYAVPIRTPAEASIHSFNLRPEFRQLDIVGTAWLVVAPICLLMAFMRRLCPSLNNPGVTASSALLVVAGSLAFAFMVLEKTSVTGGAGAVHRNISRDRNTWLVASMPYVWRPASTLAPFPPLWFQAVRSYSPLTSGTMLTPLIAGYVARSVVAPGITTGMSYYNPDDHRHCAMVAGLELLTTTNLKSSTAQTAGLQLRYGCGVGFNLGRPSCGANSLI